jgi:UDPglucose 6-dehydrogenase
MLTLATDMYDAAKGADALVVCTDWDDFKSPDFDELRKLLKSPVIFDGRNLYRTGDLRRLGFHYISIGRQPTRPNA